MAKRTAKQFYNSVNKLECVATCTSSNIDECNAFMDGTKSFLQRYINWLKSIALNTIGWLGEIHININTNVKDGLVVVHSAIEYFFKIY